MKKLFIIGVLATKVVNHSRLQKKYKSRMDLCLSSEKPDWHKYKVNKIHWEYHLNARTALKSILHDYIQEL